MHPSTLLKRYKYWYTHVYWLRVNVDQWKPGT